MRAAFLLLTSLLAGCVITGGPSCPDACNKAVACPGLDKQWLLACSPFVQQCTNDYASCAACILARDCQELTAGACDDPCRSLPAPVPLDLSQPRRDSDPRLTRPRSL